MSPHMQIQNSFLNELPLSEVLLSFISDNDNYAEFIEKTADELIKRKELENEQKQQNCDLLSSK